MMSSSLPDQANTTNIITFPKKNVRGDMSVPVAEDLEFDDDAERTMRMYADQLVDSYMTGIVDELRQQGYHLTNPKFINKMKITAEMLRASILSLVNLSHPFDKLIREIVRIMEKPPSERPPVA